MITVANRIYVANWGGETLQAFDLSTGKSLLKIDLGYANPTFDQRIKAGEQQIEQSQRVPIYQDIAQQMLTDLPVAPVVRWNQQSVRRACRAADGPDRGELRRDGCRSRMACAHPVSR